jgi:FAD/FMN-containing dehydrogenase
MGAGVQAFEAYAAANTQGLRVVGGECPTVGIAGGYTQGGGHSVLASVYGLGADQALEWEVVTADGTLLTATPTQNSELYWALSGGGGGTYGVVLSLTAKAHADGAVGGATIDFALAEDLSDKSWNGIAAWHSALPAIVDNGIVAVYFITQSGFSMLALTAPGKSAAQVTAILSPFTTTLQKLGVPYTLNVTEFSSYYEHVSYYLGPLPYGELIASENIGGRLIPRSVIQDNNNAVTEAVYTITRNPAFDWIGIALNVSHATAGNVAGSNAVLPAWRNALIDATVTANWNFTAPLAYNHAHLNLITDTLVPLLESITPGSGSYLNEGDFQQTNYQESFYGSNYDTLLAIKNKYDPNHLFYAITAVGSEAWTAEANGRLCRTS